MKITFNFNSVQYFDSVAKDSIYHYLETQLGLDISYSSKSITFEPFTEREYNVLGKYNRHIPQQ